MDSDLSKRDHPTRSLILCCCDVEFEKYALHHIRLETLQARRALSRQFGGQIQYGLRMVTALIQ